MTKKHFMELAKRIRYANSLGYRLDLDHWTNTQIELLADWIASFNPHFDKDRWIEYVKTGKDNRGEN